MDLERTDRVPLPSTEARCQPAACSQQSTCARRLAALPHIGATLRDFSLEPRGRDGCFWWLSASDAAHAKRQPPPPRRHPPIGST